MFYSCVQLPVTVKVNTLASKHVKLNENAASCSKVQRTPQKGDLWVLESSGCRELLGSAGMQGRPMAALDFSTTVNHPRKIE